MNHVTSIIEVLRAAPNSVAVISTQGAAQIVAHSNGYKNGFGISVQHRSRRFAVAGFNRRPSGGALADAIFAARQYVEKHGLFND